MGSLWRHLDKGNHLGTGSGELSYFKCTLGGGNFNSLLKVTTGFAKHRGQRLLRCRGSNRGKHALRRAFELNIDGVGGTEAFETGVQC